MAIALRTHARLAALVLVVLAACWLERAGALRWIENAAVERRMAAASRDASGQIAFLAIDNRSIEGIGTWPWPREVHAEISRRLLALGAAEVFFDIDFSAASDEASDAALAQAFDEAGSAVILAAFRQAEGVADPSGDSANLPLPRFREHVWLASVNVAADADGRIRRYPFGQTIAGEDVDSAAALLSGSFGPIGTDFPINLAVMPHSVPTYGVVDLLEGRLGPKEIEGRSIVVGAHAIELRDNLAVPVHGIIPGAMLQILAAETLLAGIVPVRLAAWPLVLALAGAAIGAAVGPLGRRPAWLLAGFAIAAIGLEAAGFALFASDALIVPTPVLHAILLSVCLTVAARELDVRHWLLQLARVETSNKQAVLGRIFADSSDAIIVVDEEGLVIEMSECARRLFTVADAPSDTHLSRIVPRELALAALAVMNDLRRGSWRAEAPRDLTFECEGRRTHLEYTVTPSRLKRMRHRFGVADELIVGCITARDVTLAREQQQRLDHLARFDVLTGATNRTEFLAELTLRLAEGSRPAVFAMNLHRFKTINTTLGRSVGDELLQAFVARIEGLVPDASGLARLGGDAFAVFHEASDANDARRIAKNLIEAIERPFELSRSAARVGLRVGIALCDGRDTGTADSLLDDAELALDEARRSAGDSIALFEEASSSRQERSRQIERALWNAIENDELFLAYQPQIALADLRFVGAEALVRWKHPTMGMISPAEFIEVAEGNGFIEKLGRWVLEQACQDAAAWPETMTVAVNVSPLQLQRSDVVADARRALAISGLMPSRLHLEITESMFVVGSSELVETLHGLRLLGISLALDDFGSGFSSFGYLGTLPLDKLKLDRMFMKGLPDDTANVAVVRSVAALARDLGLTLVCEGIESEAESEFLRGLAVCQGQGYYYAKPQQQEQIIELFWPPDRVTA